MEIRVKDFCDTPGPALAADGNSSGEEFRELVLRPAFDILYEIVRNDEKSEERLIVDLDDVYGYAHQWLDEVFSGIILFNSYPEIKVFTNFVDVKCEKEPYLVDVIKDIIIETLEVIEEEEKKSQSDCQRNNADVARKGVEEIGPRQHIYVADEHGVLQEIIACKNDYRYPCWCCEWSPEFKGTRINTKNCEHGFENGAGCGVCDINCQNLCPHGFTNAGKFCTDCMIHNKAIITGVKKDKKCIHDHKENDCSICALCEHGYFKQNCGVCRECKHGVNQSGLGCDKCDTDDVEDLYGFIPKEFLESVDVGEETTNEVSVGYLESLCL